MIFDPANAKLAVPNDLLFSGTNDGTLVFPLEKNADGSLKDNPDYVDATTALGAFDGWSTSIPFAIEVAMGVEGATIDSTGLPQAVHLFEANLGGALSPVTQCKALADVSLCEIVTELTYGVDFEAQAVGNQIVIVPLKPLKAAQGYLMVLTNQVNDSEGNQLRGSSTYETVNMDVDTAPLPLPAQLALQTIINSYEEGAAAFVNKDDIIYSAGFTTQSVVDVYETAKLLMATTPGYQPVMTAPVSLGVDVATVLGLADGPAKDVAQLADLYAATITVPNYGECSQDACLDGTTPLINSRWKAQYDSPVAVLSAIQSGTLSLANFATQAAVNGVDPAAALGDPEQGIAPNPALLVGNTWLLDDGTAADKTKHLTRFNPIPEVISSETIKVQITIPNETKLQALYGPGYTAPAGGWPTVIALHGFGQAKESALAVAGAYAAAGIATVAIDMPLHGERSFGLVGGSYTITATDDAFGEAIGKMDEFNDGSPLVFVNIASPLTVRDNLRQATLDHLALRFALTNTTLLDSSKISIQGLSLGAIVGTSVAAYANTEVFTPGGASLGKPYAIERVSLVAPTAGLAGSFVGSASIGPVLFDSIVATSDFQALVDGANTAGFVAGSPEHAGLVQAVYAGFIPKFVFAIQTAVDSVDPLNHAVALVDAAIPVQVIEIVGDDSNLADQVLPNRVAQFPLSGTEPLITSLDLDDKCVDSGTVTGSGVVRFVKGHHSSLVNPNEVDSVTDGLALEATGAMQAQVAGFAATGDIIIAPAQEPLLQTCL